MSAARGLVICALVGATFAAADVLAAQHGKIVHPIDPAELAKADAAGGWDRDAGSSADSQPVDCSAYVGRSVTPISFGEAIKRYAAVAPKSEFETTTQYEARRSAALNGTSGPLIIEKPVEKRTEFFPYDADTQRLTIVSYAFNNVLFPAAQALDAAGSSVEANPIDNVDAVIDQTDRATGSYEATNGFGARFTVTKVERTANVIFDRGAVGNNVDEPLFPNMARLGEPTRPVGELNISPEVARTLRPSLRVALVAQPKEPYLIRGTTRTGQTTLQNPFEITLNFTVLVANIQCGLVMDGAGKVLGAYPTF